MTDAGIARLFRHEGEVLHAYTDSEGFLSIGIGHLIDERRGGGITQRISRVIFEDDISGKTIDARNAFPWFEGLDPVRQDVIVNLCFNLGVAGLSKFHLMIGHIVSHNWVGAAYELSNSLWGRQVQKDRKDELCDALEHGRWD